MAIEVRPGRDINFEGGAISWREVIQFQGFHSEGDLVVWKWRIVFVIIEGGEHIDRGIEGLHQNEFNSRPNDIRDKGMIRKMMWINYHRIIIIVRWIQPIITSRWSKWWRFRANWMLKMSLIFWPSHLSTIRVWRSPRICINWELSLLNILNCMAKARKLCDSTWSRKISPYRWPFGLWKSNNSTIFSRNGSHVLVKLARSCKRYTAITTETFFSEGSFSRIKKLLMTISVHFRRGTCSRLSICTNFWFSCYLGIFCMSTIVTPWLSLKKLIVSTVS